MYMAEIFYTQWRSVGYLLENTMIVTIHDCHKFTCPIMASEISGAVCKGPKCMAWVWSKEQKKPENGVASVVNEETVVDSATYGYCGLCHNN